MLKQKVKIDDKEDINARGITMSWKDILKEDADFPIIHAKKPYYRPDSKKIPLGKIISKEDAKRIRDNKITCLNLLNMKRCGTYYSGGKETMADIDSNGIGISFHAACPVCDEINLVAEAEKSGDFTLVDLHEQPFPKSVSPYSRVDREFGRR